MTQVIIYKQPDNQNVAVLAPTTEALQTMTLHQIGVKDVPVGLPFKILDSSELPSAPQESWEVNDADLDSGIGGQP